jgi:hypothetical protein
MSFSFVSATDFVNPNPGNLSSMQSYGNDIYIGDRGNSPYIYNRDNTFQVTDSIISNILSMEVTNSYIYVGDAGKIYQINKNSLVIYTITLTGTGNITEIIVNDNTLYFIWNTYINYIDISTPYTSNTTITPTLINLDISGSISSNLDSLTYINSYLYFANNILYRISLPVVGTNIVDVVSTTFSSSGTLIKDIAYQPLNNVILCLSRNSIYELDGSSNLNLITTNFNPSNNGNLNYIAFDGDTMYTSDNIQIYKLTTPYPLCFNEGTKILCLNQQLIDKYIAIELLRIGDFVKTYKHGYRKVNKVIQGSFKNNPKKWNMCMYKMAKTLTNGLTDDLIVTGGHSLLVDAISDEEQKRYDEMGIPSFSKSTIDNKHLLLSCCSDQFAPMQDTNLYNYYHLLLENNDDEEERFGIWANGILTETPNEKTIK